MKHAALFLFSSLLTWIAAGSAVQAAALPEPQRVAATISLEAPAVLAKMHGGTVPARSDAAVMSLVLRARDGTREATFGCRDAPREVARELCRVADRSLQTTCEKQGTSMVSHSQSLRCSLRLEDWLNRPTGELLTSLQWRLIEDSTSHGIGTDKFPFDLWMYSELMAAQPPDVLIELGNAYGGAAFHYAKLFDSMEHHGRIICVDMDHSRVDAKARSHPRITWVEGHAMAVLERVKSLIMPGESVMLIDDASHLFEPTLNQMRGYGALVTNGSWMIVEDTILHHGIENHLDDPGAYSSVEAFLAEQDEQLPQWRLAREMEERFVITWNPKGYLQRVRPPAGGCGGAACPSGNPEACVADCHFLAADLPAAQAALRAGRFVDELIAAPSSETARLAASQLYLDLPLDHHLAVEGLESGGDVTLADLARATRNAAETWCFPRASFVMPECVNILTAGALGRVPEVAARPILMRAGELHTPFHRPVDARGAALSITVGHGVAVLPGPGEAYAADLRAVVVASDAFKLLAAQPSSMKTRYQNVFCSNRPEGCTAMPGLVPLLLHDQISAPTRLLLGDDYLLDSAALSIQWPGSSRFGPHIDRPFLRKPTDKGWQFSSASMPLPPKEYPLSIQAVFLLDNFTAENGAFFAMPPTGWRGSSRYEELGNRTDLSWLDEMGGKTVTARAGQVILAHGAVWHGALPNYSPRPRLAVLVQFVPRFVRPGQRYPRSLVDGCCDGAPERLAALERLLDLVPLSAEASWVGQHKLSVGPDRPAAAKRAAERVALMEGASLADAAAAGRKNYNALLDFALGSYHLCHAPRAITLESPLFATKLLPGEQRDLGARFLQTEAEFGRLSFGFGSATGSLTAGQAGEMVKAVLRAGYRALDLAEMYPHQKDIGAALAEVWDEAGRARLAGYPARSEVFITSKLWATNMAPEHVGAALNATLAALRLTYLDRWLVHWPVALQFVGIETPGAGQIWPRSPEGLTLFARGVTLADTWRAMEELALDGTGRVRAIGLSNTPASLLHALLVEGDTPVRLRPALNQVELHPWLPQDDLRAACAAHGVPLEPYAPLASGQAELLAEPVVLRLAQRLGVSPAEFLVGWALQKSGGARVVYSTRDSTRAHAMLMAMHAMPHLAEADLADMALISTRRRVFAPADLAFLFA